MEVLFAVALTSHPRLLEQVLDNLRALHLSLVVEDHRRVLAEPGGVVVELGLGVPESFKDRVEFEELLFQTFVLGTLRDIHELLHEPLGSLGLTSARLAGDDTDLVGFVPDHVGVGHGRRSEDMRRHQGLVRDAAVLGHVFNRVQAINHLERVD